MTEQEKTSVRRVWSLAFAFVLASSIAQAHVTVTPAESKPGAVQTYTMRVPTEGQVNTISVELEIPAGVNVTLVPGDAMTTREGGRIVSILWEMDLPPGAAQTFTFEATNPTGASQLAWKAHQHLADGSVADWVGAPGTRRPASITRLAASR
jgi:uncharacterized protein YcnI